MPGRPHPVLWRCGRIVPAAIMIIATAASPLSAAPDANAALIRAVYANQTEESRRILAEGADPSATNRYGVTPLDLAATNGNDELITALLDAGADPKAAGKDGQTPLMIASRTGRPAAVQALLDAGAEVNARDDNRQTALMWAAVEGHAAVVDLLLTAGAERDAALPSGFTAWFFAARQGHRAVIDRLLEAGADVNAAMETRGGGRAPRDGTSALVLAVENAHFELAARLLDAGADPNDMRSGYAPLHILSWVRKPTHQEGINGTPPPRGSGALTSLQFLDVLVEHGADVNERLGLNADRDGSLGHGGATPFLLAARTADLPLMKALLRHGADFHTPNRQDRTPLLAAAGVGLGPEADEAASEDEAIAAVRFLLDLGAEINAVDHSGNTVMHAAAYKQAARLVPVLDQAGADITIWNQKNRQGHTPLLIAQGFRPGNFKPSAPTIAALSEVMRAHGVEPPPPPERTPKKWDE